MIFIKIQKNTDNTFTMASSIVPGQEDNSRLLEADRTRELQLQITQRTGIINSMVLPTPTDLRRLREQRNEARAFNLAKIIEILNRVSQAENDSQEFYEFHVGPGFDDDSLNTLNSRLIVYGWIGRRQGGNLIRVMYR